MGPKAHVRRVAFLPARLFRHLVGVWPSPGRCPTRVGRAGSPRPRCPNSPLNLHSVQVPKRVGRSRCPHTGAAGHLGVLPAGPPRPARCIGIKGAANASLSPISSAQTRPSPLASGRRQLRPIVAGNRLDPDKGQGDGARTRWETLARVNRRPRPTRQRPRRPRQGTQGTR